MNFGSNYAAGRRSRTDDRCMFAASRSRQVFAQCYGTIADVAVCRAHTHD